MTSAPALSKEFPMRRHRDEEKQQFLEQFEGSGLTQKQFADLSGVKVHTLRYWLQRRQEMPVGFVEVKTNHPTREHTAADTRICVWVGEAVKIEMDRLPQPKYVADLMRACKA